MLVEPTTIRKRKERNAGTAISILGCWNCPSRLTLLPYRHTVSGGQAWALREQRPGRPWDMKPGHGYFGRLSIQPTEPPFMQTISSRDPTTSAIVSSGRPGAGFSCIRQGIFRPPRRLQPPCLCRINHVKRVGIFHWSPVLAVLSADSPQAGRRESPHRLRTIIPRGKTVVASRQLRLPIG